MKKRLCRIISAALVLVLLIPLAGCDILWEMRANEFVDVSSDDWYFPYVVHGLRFGLIDGERGGYFEPDRTVTVAEFVTMLGRLHEHGNDTIGTPGEGAPYERYLNWAAELELDFTRYRRQYVRYVQYIDLTLPDALITREQMAVMVVCYIRVFELTGYFEHGFTMIDMWLGDGTESYWASASINFLRNRLLEFDTPLWHFRPRDYATRAEVLQLLVPICFAVYDLRHPVPWHSAWDLFN